MKKSAAIDSKKPGTLEAQVNSSIPSVDGTTELTVCENTKTICVVLHWNSTN